MRTLLRCLLVSVLIASLIEAPVMAGPSAALGVVMQAEHAEVSAAAAEAGVTVFDGDTLATATAGALRVRLGEAQLYLLGDSHAAMHKTTAGSSAVLQQGSAVLSSTAGPAVEIDASAARIRPKTMQRTLAQVTLAGPNTLLVTSQHGQLEVLIGEEVHVVPEATSYRVEIEPEVPGPQGRPPVRAARSRFIYIALIGIAAGTAVGIWLATRSPSSN